MEKQEKISEDELLVMMKKEKEIKSSFEAEKRKWFGIVALYNKRRTELFFKLLSEQRLAWCTKCKEAKPEKKRHRGQSSLGGHREIR